MTGHRSPLRVLIIGGYGIFGSRLAELLADVPGISLIIAGRSLARASALCARLSGRAQFFPAFLDRQQPLPPQFDVLRPNIVVDASGPFQAYGSALYGVVEAAIACGAHYYDFSDGAAFVRGTVQFDAEAKQRGITVLSGVSSFPVLTAAVVRHLSADLADVSEIRAGIAPSPHAVVGANVIRAITTYAGQPVAIRRGGDTATAYPLTETLRRTIAAPGRVPLPNTLFSLVEVPDLLLLTDLWPNVGQVWVGAGPRPEILHRMLIGLSFLVRWKLLPSLRPLAGLLHQANRILRWGAHRGGMFVEIAGRDRDGMAVRRSWHLNAEGADGPYIPSMAIEALIRKHFTGEAPPPGARSATDALTLADYDKVFAGRALHHGSRDEGSPDGKPLYVRILGSAYQCLPQPIQAMHWLEADKTAVGMASVERGTGLLARLAAAVIGFPSAGTNIPVTVRFEKRGEEEIWHRDFGGDRFASRQAPGMGRNHLLVEERFGPLSFGLAVTADENRLGLSVRNWRFLRLPLPRVLAPASRSFESAEDGRFNFHVEISHPLCGLIVRYKGWLVPEKPENAG